MPGKKRKHVEEETAKEDTITAENETALNSAARKVFAEMRAIKQQKQENNVTKSKESSSKKGKSKKSKKKEKTGVIYLGHIPHGFYEEQMKSFFSQFGDVTRLKLARCKKTGRSKS